MSPPRQPRVRTDSRCGGRAVPSFACRFSGCELRVGVSRRETRNAKLEIQEEANQASGAVIVGIAVVLKGDVHAPVQANPLPPVDRVVPDRKIEQRGGRCVCTSLEELVAFPSKFVAEADEVLLIVSLGDA